MQMLHAPSRVKGKKLHREILITLVHLSPPPQGDIPPQKCTWVTTRQIANAHDISIYKARSLLLQLADRNLVMVTDHPVNNSLRWYPNRVAITSIYA